MANEKLNISGWNAGWPQGLLSNIDEAVADADGQTISTSQGGDTVLLDFDNVAVIVDADTVNSVSVTIRASFDDLLDLGATGGLNVSLFIDSLLKGTEATGNLSSTMSNKGLTNVGWDVDWTAAQLDSLQILVTTTGGEDAPIWLLDCIDVNVDYSEAALMLPAAIALALAGQEPVVDIPGQETTLRVALALTGYAPTIDNVVSVPTGALTTDGKISYLSTVFEQLQINGWDAGWPTGFATNVDEPISAADGQSISTTFDGDSVFLDLDDVTDTVNEDDVLGVTMTVRAKVDVLGGGSFLEDAFISVELYVDGTSKGSDTAFISAAEGTFQNFPVSHIGWNENWTVAQLNAMRIKLTAGAIVIGSSGWRISLDTIDTFVEHSPQSPKLISPPIAALTLATAAPTARQDLFRLPAVETAALAGQAPSLKLEEQVLPSDVALMFDGQAPVASTNFAMLPAVETAVLAGQAPVDVIASTVAPAVETLVLAGKVPTLELTANHLPLPPRQRVFLLTEAPSIDGESNPPRSLLGLTTDAPTFEIGVSHLIVMQRSFVNISSAASVLQIGDNIPVATAALTLAPLTPVRVGGTPVDVPGTATLALTTYTPSAEFGFAELALATFAPTAITTHASVPAALALTLTGHVPIVENASVHQPTGALTLAGQAPSMAFSSFLTPGKPGLISLSIDRRIEFIATPTDILIE